MVSPSIIEDKCVVKKVNKVFKVTQINNLIMFCRKPIYDTWNLGDYFEKNVFNYLLLCVDTEFCDVNEIEIKRAQKS